MKISKGKLDLKPKVLVCGPPGIGKSTFAAGFPKPIFLETENRTGHLDIHRATIERWPEIFSAFKELLKSSEYETIVIDTLDALEVRLLEDLAKQKGVQSHEEIGGGFAKYRTYLRQELKKFMMAIDDLVAAGKQVIILSHAHVKEYRPPDGAPYDRFTLQTDAKTNDFIIANMDLVGYAHFDTMVQTDQQRKKGRAKSLGKRIIEWKYNPAFPSKQGIPFADKTGLSYADFIEGLQ